MCNEAFWFAQGQANHIMDRLIAEEGVEPAIIVSMDNSSYDISASSGHLDWDYEAIEKNIRENIIPYMEDNYNVGEEAKDRAFAGFSMGGLTATHLTFHASDIFDYFGIMSGFGIDNVTYKDGYIWTKEDMINNPTVVLENIVVPETLKDDTVFIVYGNCEQFDSRYFDTYFKYLIEKELFTGDYIDAATQYGEVYGGHDAYAWAQSLYYFIRDMAFKDEAEPGDPLETNVTDIYKGDYDLSGNALTEDGTGVKVVADSDSPTGYMANFVYDPATNDRLGMVRGEEVTDVALYLSSKLVSGAYDDDGFDNLTFHGPDEYVQGDFPNTFFVDIERWDENGDPETLNDSSEAADVGYYKMKLNEETGYYELSVPVTSGAHAYNITTTISRTVQTDDPANPSGVRANEDVSDTIQNGAMIYDRVNSTVYGKYDPDKQDGSPNMDFMAPID
jgi:esterase/lipase superfamily enzyme